MRGVALNTHWQLGHGERFAARLPAFVREVLTGIGQCMLQGDARTGLLFLVGVTVSSHKVALGLALGAVVGTCWSHLRSYDEATRRQGLHGFNAALVGAATALLLEPGWLAWLAAGFACVVATELAESAQRRLPFSVYTAPFVLATWLLLFVADRLGMPAAALQPIGFDSMAKGVAAGVGQVFFVDSELSGLLIVLGIAAANWSAALWAVAGSAIGAIGASGAGLAADEIAAGLFGYNSALVAIALASRGMPAWLVAAASLATVVVVLALKAIGIAPLTAPFVLTTWAAIAAWQWMARLRSRLESHQNVEE